MHIAYFNFYWEVLIVQNIPIFGTSLPDHWNLPLVLNAIGVAIGKPLWPFDIGDVEAKTKSCEFIEISF